MLPLTPNMHVPHPPPRTDQPSHNMQDKSIQTKELPFPSVPFNLEAFKKKLNNSESGSTTTTTTFSSGGGGRGVGEKNDDDDPEPDTVHLNHINEAELGDNPFVQSVNTWVGGDASSSLQCSICISLLCLQKHTNRVLIREVSPRCSHHQVLPQLTTKKNH